MNLGAPHSMPLLLDACVLIDFLEADQTVFRSISQHVAPLHVISPVVEEIRSCRSTNELEQLGVIVIEPEIEDAYTAARAPGAISFPDLLCCLTAKRLGMVCVTNDKCLRRFCRQHAVSVVWGLELLAQLNRTKGITQERAINLAERIHFSNPRHITTVILAQFKATVRSQSE